MQQMQTDRHEAIRQVHGRVPGSLEDAWVRIALNGEKETVRLIIRTTALRNRFNAKHDKVADPDRETSSLVVDLMAVK